ncbi:hypothetical protein PMAYCL1PPCAC_10666, partial [Pristionchus mayeri]
IREQYNSLKCQHIHPAEIIIAIVYRSFSTPKIGISDRRYRDSLRELIRAHCEGRRSGPHRCGCACRPRMQSSLRILQIFGCRASWCADALWLPTIQRGRAR